MKLFLIGRLAKITLALALLIGTSLFFLPKQIDAISGGQEATPGEFPFAVRTNGCGGSLISSQWVLSAAHCFGGYHDPVNNKLTFVFDVSVGGHYNSGRDGEQFQVARAYKAPDVNGVDMDIMLLKLNRPVTFSDRVQPIPYNNDPEFAKSGTVTLMGWGADCMGGNCSPSQVLRFYRTKITGNLPTQIQFGSAADTNNGICSQDSGSAAVKRNNNRRYILLGAHTDAICTNGLSWGSDVSLVANWVYQITGVAGNTNSDATVPTPTTVTPQDDSSQEDNSSQGCVIPSSGPWPPCATGANLRPSNREGCIIPPSGPWPQCAR